MRIVLTGGGSGGHIFPIVVVSRELKRISPNYNIKHMDLYYIGPNGFSKDILKKEGIHTRIIPAGKIRRYVSFKQGTDIIKCVLGFLGSFVQLWLVMHDAIFGKGG